MSDFRCTLAEQGEDENSQNALRTASVEAEVEGKMASTSGEAKRKNHKYTYTFANKYQIFIKNVRNTVHLDLEWYYVMQYVTTLFTIFTLR